MTFRKLWCFLRGAHSIGRKFRRANVWYVNCTTCGHVISKTDANPYPKRGKKGAQ